MIVIAKLLVFIICVFLQFKISDMHITNIAIMLIALIISSIPIIIKTDFIGDKGLNILTTLSWSGYFIASFFMPACLCYMPLAAIDIFGQRLFITAIVCTVSLIAGLNEHSLIIILLSGLAVLIQYTIKHNEHLNSELKKLRDNSKEHELLIEEKNRRLIEKQDSEIYTATLKERNRIAREIHDNVGHMLTRSILQVGAIKTINTNETLREPLEGLHETLNTAMTNIRSSVHDLHDESVDLLSAIREITDNVEDVKIELDYDVSSFVPKNIKYCFISITKEAVNNMLKHSNATRMNITLQEHPAFYQLLIHDNGTNISTKTSDGMGLTNIKDRVKGPGGNIKISTDQGFKILISIIKDTE